MKAFLLQLSLTVLAIASPVALAQQCCMAGQTCCSDQFDQLSCKSTTSCEAVGAGHKYSGGSCGPGKGDWCSLDPNPNGGGDSGGSSDGGATCGNPPVTCDECCINGKCESRQACEDALQDGLNNLIKWATIGGIAIASCCVLGCIFFIIKKKMVIANRGRGESILEVKDTTGFHNLEDNGYTAPSNM